MQSRGFQNKLVRRNKLQRGSVTPALLFISSEKNAMNNSFRSAEGGRCCWKQLAQRAGCKIIAGEWVSACARHNSTRARRFVMRLPRYYSGFQLGAQSHQSGFATSSTLDHNANSHRRQQNAESWRPLSTLSFLFAPHYIEEQQNKTHPLVCALQQTATSLGPCVRQI